MIEDFGFWIFFWEILDFIRLFFFLYIFFDIVFFGIFIFGWLDEGIWGVFLFNLVLYIVEVICGFCLLFVFIGGKGFFLGIFNVLFVDGWVFLVVVVWLFLFDFGIIMIIWLRIVWFVVFSICFFLCFCKIFFSFWLMLYVFCNKILVFLLVKLIFLSIDVIFFGLVKLKLYRWLGGRLLFFVDFCVVNFFSVFLVVFEFIEYFVFFRIILDFGDRFFKLFGGVLFILNLLKCVYYCC